MDLMQGDIMLPPPVNTPPPPAPPGAPAPPPSAPQSPVQLDRQPEEPEQTSPKKPRSKVWMYVGSLLALFIVAVGLFFGWVIWQLQPLDPKAKNQRQVTIAQGSTPSQIGETLEREKIIRSAFVFRLYVVLTGQGPSLQAGTYALSPAQGVGNVVDQLKVGKVQALRVTLVPGQTLRQIEATLVKHGFEEAEVRAAMSAQYDHPLLATRPAGASLEGYIFPDTYEIEGDGTVQDVLQKAFDALYDQISDSGLEASLQQRNLNLYQAMTLASIIQEEVPSSSEQKQVSQVFLKRLADGMPLGADPTFKYAAELMGVEPTINLNSPYNTRINKGLPPGPIANFNFSAIEAVANPAPGDYLYFVAGDDGVTHFARTFEEHERNIQRYCTIECAKY